MNVKKHAIGIIGFLILIFLLSGCEQIDAFKDTFLSGAKNASQVENSAKTIQPKPNLEDKGEQPPQTTSNQTQPNLNAKLANQSNIKKFADLAELRSFLDDNQIDALVYNHSAGLKMSREIDMGMVSEMALDEAAPGLAAAPSAGAGSDDFSQTNVQVKGVDEADIIKTDGKYIYALVKNNLFIIDAYPAAESKILSKIEFKSRPQDVYINGDRLAIYGYDDRIYDTDFYNSLRRRGEFTFFKIFDISDPQNPKQLRDLDFEGSYSNSRMIGDYIYFVTTHYNYYYIEDEPILPRILEDGEALCADAEKCAWPNIYYFDIPYYSYNFNSIAAINIQDADAEINREVYIMSNNQNMYVSLDNIYITYTRYVSEYELEVEVMKEIVLPRLSQKDKDRIAKIEAVENFILSENEKMAKVVQIIERYAAGLSNNEMADLEKEIEAKMRQKYQDISKELEKTIVHKISINQGSLEYQANGEVPGHVLNQFSMDEKDGYFRIATTKNRTWSKYIDEEQRDSYNNLYILDGDLKIAGAVEELAVGETIYSVRFMQNRAYMVTFKQTDPLFAIDLSQPTNPKVLGKLKIPGFSNYLHPYDDKYLIGIGKDASENEWGGVATKGVKLSLFDVSDINNPREVDTYILGGAGSDSIALHDHKAFLFSKDKNLLVIPVSIRESQGGGSWGNLSFVGTAVFNIDEKGFELKGKIDHSDGGQSSESDYWRGYNYYDNTVRRNLFIDNTLYSFSNKYIKMNNLENLDLINSLKLEMPGESDDFKVIN